MAATVTVNDVLEGHVGLDIECMDRIYLNGYVPTLQVGGQVAGFMIRHLGYPIPSPAIMEKIGTAFRRSVSAFADSHHIPMVRFGKDDRKIEVMKPYVAAQARTGRSGVAAVGVAQEYQNVFAASERDQGSHGKAVWFSFYKADRRVTCFYFYLWDADFGPAFIKVCAYFPYPVKVWVNGHEWAKRQAIQAGIAFTELSNGFATCTDPRALQGICDRLGPGAITVFFERWMSILPLPLTSADRAAGYWWELSMRQVETSRTLVFDAPRRARAFFEALVADNLDIGRPDHVELIFRGHPRRLGPPTERRSRCSRPGSTPATPSGSPSTRSTSTHGSSSTSRTAARYGSRPWSTTPATCSANDACRTSTNCRPKPAPSTLACSILNVSGRAVSLRAQPLSGSHSPPSPRTAGGRPHYGSAILGSWPCSAPCASP